VERLSRRESGALICGSLPEAATLLIAAKVAAAILPEPNYSEDAIEVI
jgi:hypothetical protein